MRMEQISAIVRREYLTRIKSKGFWIATLLLPFSMAVLVIVPSLVMMKTKAQLRLTVVDAVGGLGERLEKRLASADAEAIQKIGSEPRTSPRTGSSTTPRASRTSSPRIVSNARSPVSSRRRSSPRPATTRARWSS